MNKTRDETRRYVTQLAAACPTRDDSACQLFIVPPFTSLALACEALGKAPVLVGAQNMHWEAHGAHTGEISARMISDCGATLVELGHSERRTAFGETDATVNLKVLAALGAGLKPLICVGDTALEKQFGVSVESVLRQVKIALHGVRPDQYRHVLIAYEPVWAIGERGTPAEPGYVNQVHAAIRQALTRLSAQAATVPILYGGSVDTGNAAALSRQPDVNGLFVGRAAWTADGLLAIRHIVTGGAAS
jgi:triosephosphate isomerase